MPYLMILFAVVIGFAVVIRVIVKAVNSISSPTQGVQNSIQQRQFSGGVIHQQSTRQMPPPPQQERLPENMSLEEFVTYMAQKRKSPENQPLNAPLSLERLEYGRKKEDIFTEEVVQNLSSHYSEEVLSEKYRSRHNQGLQIQHHQHKFGQANEAAYQKGAKNDAYDLPAGNVRGSRLSQIVGSRNNFRKFMLLKEVLDRKEGW